MFVVYKNDTKEIGKICSEDIGVFPNTDETAVKVNYIPEWPPQKRGIRFVQMFDPDNNTVYYTETPRALTREEMLEADNESLRAEVVRLSQRDATMQDDQMFVFEVLANACLL
ncbi:hypothetical protein [Paenibacillus sp. sgz500958]|uniref:hypothetical protein n=1 Tax=Paenibacillus sp. sgz500958 TaxID=3242475 RepID=UPI0036D252A2